MVIHKRTRLTPIQRQEVYQAYHRENRKVSDLAVAYHDRRFTRFFSGGGNRTLRSTTAGTSGSPVSGMGSNVCQRSRKRSKTV
jgi:hypothetical protein